MGRPLGSGNKKGKKAQRDYSEERDTAERKFTEQFESIQDPLARNLFLQTINLSLTKHSKRYGMRNITAKRNART